MFGYLVGQVRVASGGLLRVGTQVREENLASVCRVLVREGRVGAQLGSER